MTLWSANHILFFKKYYRKSFTKRSTLIARLQEFVQILVQWLSKDPDIASSSSASNVVYQLEIRSPFLNPEIQYYFSWNLVVSTLSMLPKLE